MPIKIIRKVGCHVCMGKQKYNKLLFTLQARYVFAEAIYL